MQAAGTLKMVCSHYLKHPPQDQSAPAPSCEDIQNKILEDQPSPVDNLDKTCGANIVTLVLGRVKIEKFT